MSDTSEIVQDDNLIEWRLAPPPPTADTFHQVIRQAQALITRATFEAPLGVDCSDLWLAKVALEAFKTRILG